MAKPHKTTLTLEEAQVLISKQQSQINRAETRKIEAQSRLFDAMFEGKPVPDNAQLKADYIYMKEELKKVIEQRDMYKKLHLAYKAENHTLREALKITQK